MSQSFDFVIVGAGIIGLTVAWELKKINPLCTVAILEKELSAGLHASGRNSGVLHSGVYYGNDTLKSQFCSTGAKKMKEFAIEHGIATSQSGKVIIATSSSDLPVIDKLLKNATDNNINARKLNVAEVAKIEPYASTYQSGIYSPETAVIDSIGVIDRLHILLQDKGVEFKFNSPLLNQDERRRVIFTPNENLSYGYLYNCAGAHSDLVAKLFNRGLDYTMIPFKGIYYKLHPSKRHLVNGSIYPVPNPKLPFLGVHLTRVIGGDVYVGPTAIPALSRENYKGLEDVTIKESARISSELIGMYLKNRENFRFLAHAEVKKYFKPWFVESAQKLVARLEANDLIASNKVGIRPQLVNINTKTIEMDYVIESTECSIHILNSISPAFTSSFEFSKYIVNKSLV